MLRELGLILKEYGLSSTVSIAALFLIIYLLKDQIPNIFKINEGGKSFDDRKQELLTHDFFINIDHKISIQIGRTNFSENEGRNELYRDILSILFSVYKELLEQSIRKMNKGMSIEQWTDAMLSFYYETSREFKRRCEKSDIPDKAIILFEEWLETYFYRTFEHINALAKMPDDVDIIIRTRFMLLTSELILISILADAQKFKKINGKLNDLKYKGLTL